jgi:ABC-type multidrug transport system ATPase subunit
MDLSGAISPGKCYFGRCPPGSHTIRKYDIFFIFLVLVILVIVIEYYRGQFKDINNREVDVIDETDTSDIAVDELIDLNEHEPILIEFNEVCIVLPSGECILNNASGVIHPGRLCAIMGPSGAGKSTLLDTLIGKLKPTTGYIQLNGDENFQKYRKKITVVPQNDIMLAQLTVYQVLYYSAMLRLPTDMKYSEKLEKIDNVIEFLGLDRVKHHKIGNEEERGISGGQKKRVNIGLELVCDPRVLLLDEPTSGLDSSTASKICSIIHSAAKKETLTVVAVVHSPSVRTLNCFDDIILLGNGGRIVYCGPTKWCARYFEHLGYKCPNDLTPPEFYLEILTDKIKSDTYEFLCIPMLQLIWSKIYAKYKQKLKNTGFAPNFDEFAPIVKEIYKEHTSKASNASILISEKRKETPRNFTFEERVKVILSPFYNMKIWILSVGEEIISWGSFQRDPELAKYDIGFFKTLYICFQRAFVQTFQSAFSILGEQAMNFGCGLAIAFSVQHSLFLGPIPEEICKVTTLPLIKHCFSPILDHIPYIATFCNVAIIFGGFTSGVNTFGLERTVYWRESFSGLRAFPYFISKSIVDLIRVIMAGTTFTLTFVSVYPNAANFSDLLQINICLYLFGYVSGYWASILLGPKYCGLFGVANILIWVLTFGGVEPSLITVREEWGPKFEWLWNVSAPRWAISAFYLAETENRLHLDPMKKGRSRFAYIDDTIPSNLINILYICAFWWILAFIILKFTHRDKQR